MVEGRAWTAVMTMSSERDHADAGWTARVLLKTLAFYQRLISPAFGRRCRYLPTCSEYAKTAVQRFGAWKGVMMAGGRLLRCQPFGSSGFDPVPPMERGVESC